uniref:Uncharacterized protein n=1 Tax=Arundo donax TaxID=35708 RepID=A0A0A9HXN5_ARUDO
MKHVLNSTPKETCSANASNYMPLTFDIS